MTSLATRLRVFLKDPLFSTGKGGHAPEGSVILEGEAQDGLPGGLTLRVKAWMDQGGRPLVGDPAVLYLPNSKIDHVLILEAT